MNPIIDNRIACDIEFAQTLVDFLNAIRDGKQVNHLSLLYLISNAENLLAYQRNTCTSTEEKEFFSRIGKPLIPEKNNRTCRNM